MPYATRPRRPGPDLNQMHDDALIDRTAMADLSGFTPQTLKQWAMAGRGPVVTVIEGRPRYRVGDARSWLRGGA